MASITMQTNKRNNLLIINAKQIILEDEVLYNGHVIVESDGRVNSGYNRAPGIGYQPISSDDRLKHNEKTIKNGLEIIRQLNPQFYQKTMDFKHPDFSGILTQPYILEAGFIAQEVEDISDLSFTVLRGDISTPYALNYNNIFTYGIAGIQELDNKVML